MRLTHWTPVVRDFASWGIERPLAPATSLCTQASTPPSGSPRNLGQKLIRLRQKAETVGAEEAVKDGSQACFAGARQPIRMSWCDA